MKFSVFDPHRRCWDYYEAPGTSVDYGARGTKYRSLTQRPQGPSHGLAGSGSGVGLIGFAPEALALKLPANAQHVGSGDLCQGVVAVTKNATHVSELRGGDGVQGLGGLGDAGEPAVVQVEATSFGKVVTAAVIASVVGVFVQRLLK